MIQCENHLLIMFKSVLKTALTENIITWCRTVIQSTLLYIYHIVGIMRIMSAILCVRSIQNETHQL